MSHGMQIMTQTMLMKFMIILKLCCECNPYLNAQPKQILCKTWMTKLLVNACQKKVTLCKMFTKSMQL